MDWLAEHAWAAWLVASLVLVGVELTTLDLLALMVAVGAAAGALSAAIGAPLAAQIVVAVIAAVAMLGVVRPVALRHLRTPLELRTGTERLVGSDAVVLERVDAHGGRVKLDGETWSARAYAAEGTAEPGEIVNVIEIDGATAVVLPTEGTVR